MKIRCLELWRGSCLRNLDTSFCDLGARKSCEEDDDLVSAMRFSLVARVALLPRAIRRPRIEKRSRLNAVDRDMHRGEGLCLICSSLPGNIVIGDGVARSHFLRLSAVDAEKKQARMAPSARLVIPLAGLVQAIEMLDKLRGELVRQAPAGPPAAPESTL